MFQTTPIGNTVTVSNIAGSDGGVSAIDRDQKNANGNGNGNVVYAVVGAGSGDVVSIFGNNYISTSWKNFYFMHICNLY